MAAAGLTLFILCIFRIVLDVKGIAPIPQANSWRWGLALILASCLMVMVTFSWRWAP